MTNSPSAYQNIGVIGAGAWGTALATAAHRAGRNVTLWAHNPKVADTIKTTGENTAYLPGIQLNAEIEATADLSMACTQKDALLLVTPAQSLRTILEELKTHVKKDLPIVICSKGFERHTNALLSDIVRDVLPQAHACILSGPSFAADVANGLPTAVTLAAEKLKIAVALSNTLGSRSLRPYASDDLIGAQVGGAVKNVLAIACGIVVGKSLGESARSALTCRGFAELTRFGIAHGARIETLGGLSGLGDLILTCTSRKSRNMSLGLALGEGAALADIMSQRTAVTEGVHTASVVCEMAAAKNIEMPVCEAIRDITAGTVSVDAAIETLMARPFRQE